MMENIQHISYLILLNLLTEKYSETRGRMMIGTHFTILSYARRGRMMIGTLFFEYMYLVQQSCTLLVNDNLTTNKVRDCCTKYIYSKKRVPIIIRPKDPGISPKIGVFHQKSV